MRFDAVPAASIAFLVWLSGNCGNENDIDCRFGADRPLRQIKSQFLNVTVMPREPVPNVRWRIEIKKLLKTIGRIDHFHSIYAGSRISLPVIAMENPEPSGTGVVLVIAGNWNARSTSTRPRLRATPIRGNASGPAASAAGKETHASTKDHPCPRKFGAATGSGRRSRQRPFRSWVGGQATAQLNHAILGTSPTRSKELQLRGCGSTSAIDSDGGRCIRIGLR